MRIEFAEASLNNSMVELVETTGNSGCFVKSQDVSNESQSVFEIKIFSSTNSVTLSLLFRSINAGNDFTSPAW